MREKDGLRKYGCWAGNPDGQSEDVARCITGVWSKGGWSRETQCNRKRGYGPDGLYCQQHNPVRVAEKDKARQEKYDAEIAARRQTYRLNSAAPAMLEALKTVSQWCEHNGCGVGRTAEPFWLDDVNAAIAKAEGR